MSPRKILIDTDPGQDDAFAILRALGSPEELEIVGVTAVAGNVPLSRTARNAQMILELAGRGDITVYPGCQRPMVRPLFTAEYVHGDSGLDGGDLPEPVQPLGQTHGVDFIIQTIMAHQPGEITICPLGPMTNVAWQWSRSLQSFRAYERSCSWGAASSKAAIRHRRRSSTYMSIRMRHMSCSRRVFR